MDTYTHGHHDSVVGHHAARTVANSAAFLVPHLEAGARLLDIGCGPGSITVELAELVAPGPVLGVDIVESVLDEGRRRALGAGCENVEFRQGDIYALDEAGGSFDVVYAHQVLQHLSDPVQALGEMRRLLADGGIVAVRDADYAAMAWAPRHPSLDRWMELYRQVTARNGAEADAGRHLLGWLTAAGFAEIEISSSTWTYAEESSRRWWGEGWSRRATESAFAAQAIEYGLSTAEELEEISRTWQWWSTQPDGFFVVLHVEAIGRR